MSIIPLIRPKIPSMDKWKRHYEVSIRSNHYTNFGPNHEEACRLLSWKTKRPTLLVTNGTAAITIALLTTMKPGSRIAIPSFTVPATLQAIYSAGMTPVILGTNPNTWTLDVSDLSLNQEKYDGFIVVSPFGYFVNSDFCNDISLALKKPFIFDFAGGWGQFPQTEAPVTYSFHATKNFAIGEGGCISFKDVESLKMARSLINFGYEEKRNVKTAFAMNAKMDEMRASIVLSVLDDYAELERKIDNKKSLYLKYASELGDIGIEPIYLERVKSGSPSLCVYRFPRMGSYIEENSSEYGFVTRQYYNPCVNEMDIAKGVLNLERDSSYFKDCVALPSSVTDPEFYTVVRGMKLLYERYTHEQRTIS